jgi:hypothetical protein
MVAQSGGERARRMSAAAAALWARLARAGLVSGEMPAAQDAAAPWYVRVMLCFAGLLAAAFLLGFVAVGAPFLIENRTAASATGLALVAAAYALFRSAPRSDFGAMFALAVSFAGQALFIFGFLALFDQGAGAGTWLAITAVELVLALVMPNFIHRLSSAYAAGVAATYALVSLGAGAFAAGLALLVAFLWLNEARFARNHAVLAPLAYGLTLAFIHIEALAFGGEWMAVPSMQEATPWGAAWMGEALVSAALLATVVTLLKRAGTAWDDRRAAPAIGACAAIGLASLEAPGIAGGLMIVVLGHANGNRVLAGLGVAGLVFYVSAYYYLLELTLMRKSAVLAATGVVLLAARWIVLERVLNGKARNA